MQPDAAYLADKGPALLPTWLYEQMPTVPLLAQDRTHKRVTGKGHGAWQLALPGATW